MKPEIQTLEQTIKYIKANTYDGKYVGSLKVYELAKQYLEQEKKEPSQTSKQKERTFDEILQGIVDSNHKVTLSYLRGEYITFRSRGLNYHKAIGELHRLYMPSQINVKRK